MPKRPDQAMADAWRERVRIPVAGETGKALVQLGGYCSRLALPLMNLAYLLAGDRFL